MGLRVPLLCVDEVRELGRVTDEEHRSVVEDPVKVALLSLNLDSETYSEDALDEWMNENEDRSN